MIENWHDYQIKNNQHIIKTDILDANNIRYIGGLDISFDKKNDTLACAYLTLFDLQMNQIIYEDYQLCNMDIPYISGFLGFREIPHYKALLNKIKDEDFYPHVLFIDGFGILHPREFGSASHIGFDLDIPSIGIAKNMLEHDGLSENKVKVKFKTECSKKGDYIDLIGNSGRIWGIALKSCDNAVNPIYVTIGHKISIETARKLVIKTCLFKNPEPIRNSDIKSKVYLKRI